MDEQRGLRNDNQLEQIARLQAAVDAKPYPRTNIHNTIHSRIELVRIAQQFITNAILGSEKLDKEAVARLGLRSPCQGLVDISYPDTRLSIWPATMHQRKTYTDVRESVIFLFPELSDGQPNTDL